MTEGDADGVSTAHQDALKQGLAAKVGSRHQ
jgi:hypothetical protein